MISQSLSHYKIIKKLGAGGMGEVYLAEDTRLRRKVALKILPAKYVNNRELLHRFEQEAYAASALNHPNILVIFEIGCEHETHFIATEFIEGQTLRELIDKAPLPLGEAVDIIIQAAGALNTAHTAGIVHRDIKPENIMVRPDGYIKILDFGLAKLVPNTLDKSEAATAMVKTEPGMIMGTVYYMSPEQARGLEVDARTDIFSLGVVLYEMVTGHRPFEGETRADVMAAILERRPPPLSDYCDEVSPALEAIVARALHKNRAERYENAQELISALKEFRQQLKDGTRITNLTRADTDKLLPANENSTLIISNQNGLATRSQQPLEGVRLFNRTRLLLITTAVVALTAAGLLWSRYYFTDDPPSAVKVNELKVARIGTTGPVKLAAISQDGKLLVYCVSEGDKESLWVKESAAEASSRTVIPAQAVSYDSLGLSRDGQDIFFTRRPRGEYTRGLYRVPVQGGESTRLDIKYSNRVPFSPDGQLIAFDFRNAISGESSLYIARADGSGERKLVSLQAPVFIENFAWSPDNKLIACVISNKPAPGDKTLVTVQTDTGEINRFHNKSWYHISHLEWLSGQRGLAIIASENAAGDRTRQIWRVSYPDGAVRRVTNDFNNYSSLSVSNSDELVTVMEAPQSAIWSASLGAKIEAKKISSHQIGQAGIDGIAFTPDGRIVFSAVTAGNNALWIMNGDGGAARKLIDGTNGIYSPKVTPDGRYIFYIMEKNGMQNLWRMNLDGSDQRQLTSDLAYNVSCFSPDSRWVFYEVVNEFYMQTVRKLPVEGNDTPQQFGDINTLHPAVSPDGKWIAAFYRDKSVKMAIIPFEGGKPVKLLDIPQSSMETNPRHIYWSADSKALLYRDHAGEAFNIWQLPIAGGPPKQLTNFAEGKIHAFALSQDGTQLICSRGVSNIDLLMVKDF